VRLGVCYYPEQWPRERWRVDAAMMVEAGLALVRIGEFAWSSYEPARDRVEWGWLDEAVEVLAAAGLDVVLGTPTATPPVWLLRERPQVLAVGPDGRRRAYGSRRHTCPTSPAYREEAARIVAALVDRYGRHEAVVAWQLDNEPGNHDSARCWCDACQDAFVGWLEARYGRIEALNEAWAGPFWSSAYPSFEAVRLPVPTMTVHDPALELAHRRFAAAQVAAGLAEQRELVHAASPGRDVCTNLYLGDVDVDARLVARPNGLAAVDSYPHGLADQAEVGFVLDLARGTALPAGAGADARGGRAWVMEQQPGPVNWTPDNPAVPPGQVRLWGWQAALHGIEALLVFRWRAARAGQEQHHAALLRHDGSPTAALAEVAQLADELAACDPATLDRPQARAALLYDYEDAWLLDVVPQVPGASHRRLTVTAAVAVRQLGCDLDVVPADADLTGYGVVLAPALHLVTDDRVRRLREAMDAGATVVTGPRTLVRDLDARWVEASTPAGLTDRLGARVDHAGSPHGWPRDPEDRSDVDIGGTRCPAGPWIETLEVDDDEVEVLARAVGGPLDGAPVAVRRGRAVHLGASSAEAWLAVLRRLPPFAGREPMGPATDRFDRGTTSVTLEHRERKVSFTERPQ
jgi:beta-galactosidase